MTSHMKPWFIRARLRTRHLLLLTALGEEGNIHRAAEALNMSQPSASRLLKDLEDIIGAELFDRLPRGVRANRFGRSMLRHAQNALSSLGEAASEIELLKSGKSGQVNLGTVSGPAVSLVPKAIARVAGEHPLVSVHVEVEASDRLFEALQDGKIEVMVGRLLQRYDTTNYSYERLADEPVCTVVRRGHPMLCAASIEMADLAEQTWIVPPVNSALRHKFELMFRDQGIPLPRQYIETVSPLMLTRLLEETDFVAILPAEVADYYIGAGLIEKLDVTLDVDLGSFGVITRKGPSLSPAAKVMYDALIDAARGKSGVRKASHSLRRSMSARHPSS